MFHTDPIIVVIATSGNRTDLLLERSLRSVYNQKNVIPHQIYIVDDNPTSGAGVESAVFHNIRDGVKRFHNECLKPRYAARSETQSATPFQQFFHTVVTPNTRTKGNSGGGAWNTAAMHALQYGGRAYFLAILDDDDEWTPDHLDICLKTAQNGRAPAKSDKRIIAAVSGINRIEPNAKRIELTADKDNFTKAKFFVGNPGLQGSNIFIELKTFWRIGGFDESLASCTDRDLALRLLDYCDNSSKADVAFTGRQTVNHYADRADRVTADKRAKRDGLNMFYRKHGHQFSRELRAESLRRAEALFGYKPPPPFGAASGRKAASSANVKVADGARKTPFNLCLGVISSKQVNLRTLLDSFASLYARDKEWLADCTIYVLDNSGCEYEIKPLAAYFRQSKGFNVELLDAEGAGDRSIASNRTKLQTEIFERGARKYNADFVAWIVDDDSLFKVDIDGGGTVQPNYFQTIAQHRTSGIDALLGLVSDAPPLPFLSALRTQLLDFYYNLSVFANYHRDEIGAEFKLNALQISETKNSEFYYDLSARWFDHLEKPYYWRCESTAPTDVCAAFQCFLEDTVNLGNGVNVFRKITFPPADIGKLGDESIYRGGNTVIYNPALLKTPNYAPRANGEADAYNRRSDFNWAIINAKALGYKIREITLPLQHNRRLQSDNIEFNKDKLRADISGLLNYRLLREMLTTDQSDETLRAFYERNKRRFIRRLQANHYRSLPLCYMIEVLLADERKWWFASPYRERLNSLLERNLATIRALKFELGKRNLQAEISKIEKRLTADARFINKMRDDIKRICKC